MAWTDSRIFDRSLIDRLDSTAALDLDTDTLTNALYNNSITPDRTVTAANTAYNVGQWATAQEVYQAGQWAQAGVNLAANDVTLPSGGIVMLDANDTASGVAATLAATYGCLIYDNTIAAPVADQGVCFLYFGGANQVTNGQLTVQYSANGIYRITT